MPTATFRVYQNNATKFQHNKKLTEGRKRRLEEAGAFRASTNARRSFEPQYGPACEIASIDSMVVRATDGTETLLKHALPVPRGSAEPKAKLTRPPGPFASFKTSTPTRGSTLIFIMNKNDRAFVHMRSCCANFRRALWHQLKRRTLHRACYLHEPMTLNAYGWQGRCSQASNPEKIFRSRYPTNTGGVCLFVFPEVSPSRSKNNSMYWMVLGRAKMFTKVLYWVYWSVVEGKVG